MEWLMTGGSLDLEISMHPDFDMGIGIGGGGGAAIFPDIQYIYSRFNLGDPIMLDLFNLGDLDML